MTSACVWTHSRFCRLSSIFLVLLLLCSSSGRGQTPAIGGTAPRPDDWITVNKDYRSQRYVDLGQITPENVANIGEICEIQLNDPVFFSSGLLKVGRTLYVNTYRGTYAFDAVTCQLRWKDVMDTFSAPLKTNNSRGSAYLDGKIFRGTPDGNLIALDANTGVQLWSNTTAAPNANEVFVSAPIAWQGKVFAGIAVGDAGIAGRMMAFDANTGKQLWAFDTTLGYNAGGGFWTTYSLDPRTGEVFGTVANPYPDFYRDGDVDKEITRYTDSAISVDAAKGTLNWSYQAVPRDDHDWDLATAPMLYRTPAGRAMVAITGKNGRVYGLDRATQSLVFNTPATTLENDQEPLTGNWLYVCPGLQGGAQFTGTAYNPATGTLYIGMNDHCAWYFSNPSAPDATNGGGVVKDWAAAAKLQAPTGWITAINGATGAVLWQYHAESQVQAGLLPTKSGLLIGGDTHGNLLVLNAADGTLLNSINTGGAINDGLISYSVGSVQYIAAAVGGATENPSKAAGPLRVVVYGLNAPSQPNVVALNRLAPPTVAGATPGLVLFFQNCLQCHGPGGAGGSAPPLLRQSQLADPEALKHFLATVPPPMPRLYPGVLTDDEVELIAGYLKTAVFQCDSINPPPPQNCSAPAKPMSGGTPAWQAIYSVLTSPRCINCHPVASPALPGFYGYPQDCPRQTDNRHPHYYTVLRGDTFPFETAEGTGVVYPGMGTPFERCTFCHGSQNDPVTGIPGTTNPDSTNPTAPFWALAPASMAWESTPGVPLSGPQLCANLLNKQLNGNRDPPDILHHLATEPLVKWSYNPGIGQNGKPRTTPPISQAALVQEFQQWIAEGTPCPSN
jgi:alcohol dehydrogenase (cytochrome c)